MIDGHISDPYLKLHPLWVPFQPCVKKHVQLLKGSISLTPELPLTEVRANSRTRALTERTTASTDNSFFTLLTSPFWLVALVTSIFAQKPVPKLCAACTLCWALPTSRRAKGAWRVNDDENHIVMMLLVPVLVAEMPVLAQALLIHDSCVLHANLASSCAVTPACSEDSSGPDISCTSLGSTRFASFRLDGLIHRFCEVDESLQSKVTIVCVCVCAYGHDGRCHRP